MSQNSASTHEILRLLNQKVRDGMLDKKLAERLAVVALEQSLGMQEVSVAEEPPVAEETTETEPAAEPVEPAKPAPAIDPKTQLLTLLTSFERETSNSFNKLRKGIEDVLKGVEGNAFPLGDVTVKSEGNNGRLNIEKADGKQDAVDLSFSFDRNWTLDGVTPPTQVQAQAEPVCHLALRKDVLAASEDLIEFSESEMAWERSKHTITAVSKISDVAKKHNDLRVKEIVAHLPKGKSREDWRKWAISAQAFLIGNDYAHDKTFTSLLEEIEVEDE